MKNVKKKRVLKKGQNANDSKPNSWVGIVGIFLFGLVFVLIGIDTFLSGMQVYRMNCSHSAGYCEVFQYDLFKFEYGLKHKIPINTIQEMYLDVNISKDETSYSYTYCTFLKTTKGNIDLETTYTDLGELRRREQISLFQNWKNNHSGDTYTYQEGRGHLVYSLIFIIVGVSFFCLYLYHFKDSKKQKKRVFKKEEIENASKQQVRFILGVCFTIGLGFFLGGGYAFLLSSQVYRMNCSHSAGYCEISRYDLSKQDYVLKHKVPVNTIQEMYLNEQEYRENTQTKTKHTYRLILKTTKGSYFLDAMDTNIGSSDKSKQISLFKNWKNNRSGDTYTYQEDRGNMILLFIFVFLGFVFLCLFVVGLLFCIKGKIQRKINNPNRMNNVIERM